MRNILQVVILGLLAACCVLAQDTTCNDGDIAWVSSAVNADVGTGLGAGRCTTNTVAGAAYNDITMPWGIQAAYDCSCSGLEIRILGNTGDYGSATNSWNNRFNATKTVAPQNIAFTIPPRSIGYADSTTSCENDNLSAGCPVMLEFTGGTSHGFTVQGQYRFWGIGAQNANNDCFNSSASNVSVAGAVFTGCGDDGVDINGSAQVWVERSWIHDNGDALTDAGVRAGGGSAKYIQFNTIESNAGIGVALTGNQVKVLHNIIYNNTGDGVQFSFRNNHVESNTIRDNGGDGIDSVNTGNSYAQTVRFNLITGSGGYGINQMSGGTLSSMMLAYNVLGGNTTADINPGLNQVAITYGNVTGATVVYASATDHTPTSGAELTLFYPRGTTQVTINAGAVSEGGGAALAGGGGGGVFTPGGHR